jgi:hypothetical protein
VRRKAAKRTLPWDLAEDEIRLAEDIRATKRPRLEEPLRTSTDEATTENTSQANAVALPLPAATVDHADSDPVMDMNAGTGAHRRWTPEEDTKLTSAVTKTRKKKWGKELRIDWKAIAVLVPGRTKQQCRSRWHDSLVSDIDTTTTLAGKWTADEDTNLKDGVREHGGKNWEAIAALVLGRTKTHRRNRWTKVNLES